MPSIMNIPLKKSPYVLIVTLIMLLNVSTVVVFGNIEPFIDFKILKISSSDNSAVIKTSNNKMVIVGVGDVLTDQGTITAIEKDRIILTHKADAGEETIFIKLVGGRQKVEKVFAHPLPKIANIKTTGNNGIKQK